MSEVIKESKLKNIGLWVLSVMLAGGFAFMASGKLMGSEMSAAGFERWGYPLWFMYVVGLMEVTGAVLLLVPRLASYGALLLGVVMLGAVATHISAAEYSMLVMPLMFGAFLAVVGWGRWPRLIVPGFLRSGSPA